MFIIKTLWRPSLRTINFSNACSKCFISSFSVYSTTSQLTLNLDNKISTISPLLGIQEESQYSLPITQLWFVTFYFYLNKNKDILFYQELKFKIISINPNPIINIIYNSNIENKNISSFWSKKKLRKKNFISWRSFYNVEYKKHLYIMVLNLALFFF
jgi:hypothetical protein